MVSLQRGFGVATSQTPVAVSFAKRPEFLGGKAARAGVPGGPALAAIVGLGRPDLVGVVFGPLLASSYYFFALTLVVSKLRSSYAILVFCCPLLLVLGYLGFVFFLVFPTRLDPVRQVCPGFLVCSVLLQVFTPVLLRARPDADFALVQMAIRHLRLFIELGEGFPDSTALANLRDHLTRCLGLCAT